MKLQILRKLIPIACLLVSMNVLAYDFESGGIYYNITSTVDKTVKVTYKDSNYNSYTGNVTIPSSVTHKGTIYSVTSIGDNAFSNCSGLRSVTIPNSVKQIGNYAFDNCTSLKDLKIEDGTEILELGYNYYNYSYSSLGEGLFSDCPLETVYLGRNLSYNTSKSSGYSPFYNQKALKAITIGNSVTQIGYYAFDNCRSLKDLKIEDGTEILELGYGYYREGLFSDCPLETVYLGRNLSYNTSNGYSPFYNQNALKAITIGNSVTSIGDNAFRYCSGLTSITIPNSVTSIGGSAFYECRGLTSITIPNSVTSIGGSAFSGCTGLTSVTIGDSVTSIGESAFEGCTGLTSVIIPNSVTSIGDNAFSNCSGLTSVTIGDSVTSIGKYAFDSCSGLTSITIPNSVTSVGNYVFEGCRSLKDLKIEDGAKVLDLGYNYDSSSSISGEGLFYDCPLETVYLGRNLSYNTSSSYGYSPFSYQKALKTITIGNNVTSIGDYAFYYCSGLTSVTIPNSVTSIGGSAFSGCSGLTSITIPNSVTQIGNYTFDNCTSLKDLKIEDGTEILELGYNYYNSEYYSTGEGLFYDCPLETVYLGRNLSYNTNMSYGYSPFYNQKALKTITIGNSVTSIGDNAFRDCSGLTSITIPNSVTSIREYAFSGCSGLTSVTIPNNVTQIGRSAFAGCTSLKDLKIEDGTEILELGYTYDSSYTRRGLFYDCPLETVYLGRNLSYETNSDYGYSPFYNQKALKTITIGNSVTSIGDYAFSGCSSLDYFAFGSGMKTIGEEAFSDCTAMTKLISRTTTPPTCGTQALDDINKWVCELFVPQSAVTAYQGANQWKEFFFITGTESSGVESTLTDEVDVSVENGNIVIKGADNAMIEVYSLNGQCVYSGIETTISIAAKGLYVVKVNGKSFKVMM